jgi:hypothetical protein
MRGAIASVFLLPFITNLPSQAAARALPSTAERIYMAATDSFGFGTLERITNTSLTILLALQWKEGLRVALKSLKNRNLPAPRRRFSCLQIS